MQTRAWLEGFFYFVFAEPFLAFAGSFCTLEMSHFRWFIGLHICPDNLTYMYLMMCALVIPRVILVSIAFLELGWTIHCKLSSQYIIKLRYSLYGNIVLQIEQTLYMRLSALLYHLMMTLSTILVCIWWKKSQRETTPVSVILFNCCSLKCMAVKMYILV